MTQTENNLTSDLQETLNKILAKIPSTSYVDLHLPSLGLFYEGDIPPQIRPLTWQDEKALIEKKEDEEGVNVLLDSCIKGLKSKDLIPMDKMYILFKLREISFGGDYDTSITCPKCGKVNEVVINTKEFPVKHLPKGFKNPRKITLPASKIKMEIRFQTSAEEKMFSDPKIAINNLWKLVETVEGEANPVVRSEVIKNLTSVDSQYLRKQIYMDEFGLDTKFAYGCPDCKAETVMEVPVGPDFFSPN